MKGTARQKAEGEGKEKRGGHAGPVLRLSFCSVLGESSLRHSCFRLGRDLEGREDGEKGRDVLSHYGLDTFSFYPRTSSRKPQMTRAVSIKKGSKGSKGMKGKRRFFPPGGTKII